MLTCSSSNSERPYDYFLSAKKPQKIALSFILLIRGCTTFVDAGDEVTQVTDEVGFEKNRGPDTKFVMRVVLTEEVKREDILKKKRSKTYTCPRCRKDTRVEHRSTASINWFDFLVVD